MKIPLQRSILFIILLFACIAVKAQQVLPTTQKDSVYKALFNRRGKSIYFEAWGSSASYSFDYDFRFNKRQNGFGMRVGVGYFDNRYNKFINVPVILNYLHGKKGHYLELGAGVTFFNNYSVEDVFFISDNSESNPHPPDYEPKLHNQTGVISSVSVGYRYQPLKGGFSFRVGGGPVATSKKQYPFWPYMSFGYSFKHKSKKAK
jgi:hypothetical protein